jgi:hypothetical protein
MTRKLSLTRFVATCENGHIVEFHEIPMEHATFIVRTQKSEEAVATINELLREVSQIAEDLIQETGIPDKGNECFQAVVGIVFDKSPLGFQYHFDEVYCPVCGSSKVFKPRPVVPEQVDILEVREVTYTVWQSLTFEEKRNRLKNALKEIGCC